MRHHHSATCQFWRERRQYGSNILVRKAMEAVATNTLIMKFVRERIRLRYFGLAAMEGGVEADHLRQSWIKHQRSPDQSKVVRLVQWRKWNQCLQFDK